MSEATHICPVCLGAGRISDVMPASDSVADVDTLRLVAGPDSAADHAYNIGGWGIYWLSRIGYRWMEGREDLADVAEFEAVERFYKAARVAFRAVPGLRG
jgi:hypothetical protein